MANYGELWRIMAKVFMANRAQHNCAIRHFAIIRHWYPPPPGVLELLGDQHIDICFLTESWLKLNDKAKFAEFREYGYNILSAPRKGRGGGVGFLFNSCIKLKRNNVVSYKSFEVLEAVLKGNDEMIRLSVVYRTTQVSSKEKYAQTRLT